MKKVKRYRLPDNVTMQQIGEESVLLNLLQGLYYRLDAVGTLMLAALLEGVSEEAVIERVTSQYDIDDQCVADDLQRIVEELRNQGLLDG